LNTAAVLTELAVGEALVSFLDEKGRPSVVERAFVVPPGTRVGPVTQPEREKLIASSAVAGIYDKAVDRESAYEKLTQRVAEAAPAAEKGRKGAGDDTATPGTPGGGGWSDKAGEILTGSRGPRGGRGREGVVEAAAKSVARAIGSQIGRELVRGVLGSLLGKRKR
jgi:DNA helicase HerA-like ATPase